MMSSLAFNSSASLVVFVEQSKKLKNEIKKNTSFDENSVMHYASRIMQLRQQLDTFENDHCQLIFIQSTMKDFGFCQKQLNKAQSILLKKSLGVIKGNNPLGLYQMIEEVWIKNTSGQTDAAQFGQRLLEKKKKDPILLAAILEHLRCQEIERLIEGIKTEKHYEYLIRLYQNIEINVRMEIEKHIGNSDFLKECLPHAKDYIVKVFEAYLLYRLEKRGSQVSKPHLHQVVSVDYYQIVEDCQKIGFEDDFLNQLAKLIEQETGQKFDQTICRQLIKQKMNHPLVVETAYSFILDQGLLPLQQSIAKGDWENNKKFFLALPQTVRNNLIGKIGFGLSELMADIDESQVKNDLSEGQKYIEQAFLKKQFDERFQAALTDVVQQFMHIICQSQKVGGRNVIALESGLFYSILTVLENDSNENPRLKQHLQLAYEALSYAVRKVPYSSNFFNRENSLYNLNQMTKSELQTVDGFIDRVREELIYNEYVSKRTKFAGVLKNDFTKAIVYGKIAEQYPVGNCGELSEAVFAYLTKIMKASALRVEICSICGDKGDHSFVVIGRPETSDPKDPRTWGAEAVICDPWARKIFPAYLAEHLLDDYTGFVIDGLPGLRRFNPHKQYIEIDTANLISSNEFRELSRIFDIPHEVKVQQLLEQFHLVPEHEDKKSLATKIVELLAPHLPYLVEDSLLTRLFAQINYFLYSKLLGPRITNA